MLLVAVDCFEEKGSVETTGRIALGINASMAANLDTAWQPRRVVRQEGIVGEEKGRFVRSGVSSLVRLHCS